MRFATTQYPTNTCRHDMINSRGPIDMYVRIAGTGPESNVSLIQLNTEEWSVHLMIMAII